ncbi:MAG: hypothetical protein HKN41_05430, partial [Ilumatobacter sp.]|nr:hypothetical protein [Ilumatobacter sp.]
PSIYELGPDDVVYLHVDSSIDDGGDELAADIIAVSLAEGDAGREIERWVGASDWIGDSELVPTRDGLVVVGCCDHVVERPAPDAGVRIPWVDRSGGPAQPAGPVMRVEVQTSAEHGSLTVHRDDDPPVGTRSWTFEPGEQWQPRGMVRVIPTFDGGFIATTWHGGGSRLHRGWADGSVLTIELDDSFLFVAGLDPVGRFLVDNGDWFARVEPFGDRTEYWAGRYDVDDDGTVRLTGIDDAIDAGAGWARDPVAFANAVTGPPEVNEIRTIDVQRLGDERFRVVVTDSNFFDDSVAATRTAFDLRRDADGRFRFDSGDWTQSCQPNRGHQDFSTDLCR